jgi:hypothetical protein
MINIVFQTPSIQRITVVKAKPEQFEFKYPSLFGIYETADGDIYETADEFIYYCR